jgi:nucleoside-diphosphate-sugar epimerase
MLRHQNLTTRLPSRVVVIGAAGFVGNALIKRLASLGASVLALGRRDIDLLASDASARLASMLRPDDVLVAVAARAPCKTVQMLSENMKIVAAMVEVLAKSPVSHVVNISSDAVYADSPSPLTEESTMAPDTLHGVMHLARELAFIHEVRAPLAILRPSLLYGAADPHNGYGPNRFRRLANEGKDIVLFGDGEERRDHVLIDDVAEVIVRVIERRSAGSLNIATGNVHSFREVAELVVANAPNRVAIKASPRNGPMPHNGYRPFDNSSTRAAFPDFNYTALPDGIAKAQHDERARNA